MVARSAENSRMEESIMMIQIPNEQKQEILSWLRQGLPNEACGLLAGVREENIVTVKKVYGMRNVDHSSSHFSMDAREQFAVIKDIRKNGWILIGNVHSYPTTKAEPSEEDIRLAYDSGIFYLICSFLEEEPKLRAFRIIDRKKVVNVQVI